MDLTTIVAAIVEKGGIAGVALLALYMLNSVYRYVLDREKSYAAEIRNDKQELLRVLNENTAAVVRLTSSIENFFHASERSDRAKS